METNILKIIAFTEIAENKSFSIAAERMSISQPNISRMIADLEKEWGFRLFERDRNGLSLTREGEAMLTHALSLRSEYNSLQSTASSLKDMNSGHIVIGTFSSVATHWLPNIIKRFRQEYPNISYELLLGDYTELEQWVSDGRVDFAFTRMPTKQDLDCTFVEKDELKAIVPENNHFADSESFPVKELAEYPFMLLEKGGKAEISEIFERNDVHPNVVFQTWDDYAVMSMVEGGLGISILPNLILKRIPYKIKSIPLDPPAYRDICVAKRKGKNLSLAAENFLNFIKFRNVNNSE